MRTIPSCDLPADVGGATANKNIIKNNSINFPIAHNCTFQESLGQDR